MVGTKTNAFHIEMCCVQDSLFAVLTSTAAVVAALRAGRWGDEPGHPGVRLTISLTFPFLWRHVLFSVCIWFGYTKTFF